eukprot:TRINITY_DN678_c0_g1_i1.p1 TRINITY_DN678_c0_g1~~TRINITY_DN678_c0_g1_i1.p1  ORF type:complete len:541 (-),score=54.95 TRINITY_DN678_c0_g1_i1:605-2227(-)
MGDYSLSVSKLVVTLLAVVSSCSYQCSANVEGDLPSATSTYEGREAGAEIKSGQRSLQQTCSIKKYDSSVVRSKFPSSFGFGVATSAFQTEGAAAIDGRGPSIWDAFQKIQGKIDNGDTATVADDVYHKYREDIALMKKLGFKHFRFSISWSRILPSGGGRVNKKGLNFYNRFINALLKAGITPSVTLYHWDLPLALHERHGGWLNKKLVAYYVNYADIVFKSYGDRVKSWITFNEPQQAAVQGYGFNGAMAPGRYTYDGKGGNSSTEPYIVAHNMILAHAAAVSLYRTKYKPTQRGTIGITLDSTMYFPLSNSAADKAAVQTALSFTLGWFADPILKGDYPAVMKAHVKGRLPSFTHKEKKAIKGTMDWFGLNSYTAVYVSPGYAPSPQSAYPWNDNWVSQSATSLTGMPIGISTGSSWLKVVPTATSGLITYIYQTYGSIPIHVTESGTSEQSYLGKAAILCDQHRIDFYVAYLANILKAIRAGANVQRYYAWSLLDNFEWARGYSERFGIVYVDFNDAARTRYPKQSAAWWKYFLSR